MQISDSPRTRALAKCDWLSGTYASDQRESQFGIRSSDERTPQEFKRSEERLAGGSHARDRRESQCGMVLRKCGMAGRPRELSLRDMNCEQARMNRTCGA